MAIYKKINGKVEKFAENSVIDHNQLANRDQYGAHSISAIRKLPEKLTSLKNKDIEQDELIKENSDHITSNTSKINEVEQKAKGINVEQKTGSFDFTDYEGNTTNIKTGYEVDDTTIVVENNKYVVKGLDFLNSSVGSVFQDPIKADDIEKYAKDTNTKLDNIEAEDIKQNTELKKHQDNIYDLQARTKGLGGYIDAYDFGKAVPTQDELTNYALTQIPSITSKEQIFNQTKVVNLFDNNVWVLTNTPDSDPIVFEWNNKGTEAVAIANNDGIKGIVTGSYEELEGFIDINGHITINGLDKVAEKANLIKTDQTSDKYLDGSGNYSTVKTNASFNPDWNISGTTLQFVESIKADTSATPGHTYLGGVQLTDLPAKLSNAECIVQIISSTLGGKVIHLDLYSANTSPYHWTCIYWNDLTAWQPDVLEEDLPVANNGEATTENLQTIKIKDVNYQIDAGGLTILNARSDFPLSADLLEKVKANPHNYCVLDYPLGNAKIYYYTGSILQNRLSYVNSTASYSQTTQSWYLNTGNISLFNGSWNNNDGPNFNQLIILDNNTIKIVQGKTTSIGVKAESANQVISGDDITDSLTIERL